MAKLNLRETRVLQCNPGHVQEWLRHLCMPILWIQLLYHFMDVREVFHTLDFFVYNKQYKIDISTNHYFTYLKTQPSTKYDKRNS